MPLSRTSDDRQDFRDVNGLVGVDLDAGSKAAFTAVHIASGVVAIASQY